MLYEKNCAYCGEPFTTPNVRRLYCKPECRRKADNENKADRRAEEAEIRDEYKMPDAWSGYLGDDVTQGALLDGWTAECEMCADEAIAGPMACQTCKHWKASASSKRKRKPALDLLCSMCRDGCRV